MLRPVPDEGDPISYEVLEHDTPVYSSDGVTVGKVARVRADLDADIFDGIEIDTHAGARYVLAEQVASIHERGVDLTLAQADVGTLAPCDPVPASYHVDPAEHRGLLARIGERLGGRGGWKRSR
jgi:hypothetical protein